MIPFAPEILLAMSTLSVLVSYDTLFFYFFAIIFFFFLIDYIIIVLPEKKLQPITKEQFVLITGCSTGIGHATALHLNSVGFSVLACVRRFEDGKKLKEDAERPETLDIVILDISNDESIDKAFEQVKTRVGKNELKALFNNAGIASENPQGKKDFSNTLQYADLNSMKKIMDINYYGTIKVTKKFWPLLNRKDATIIFNTSVVGFFSPPFMSFYAASKYALEGLVDGARREMNGSGPRFVILQCGFVTSEILEKASGTVIPIEKRSIELLEREKKVYQVMTQMNSYMSENPLVPAKIVERSIRSEKPLHRYITGGNSFLPYLLSFGPSWIPDFILPLGTDMASKVFKF